MRGRNDGTLCVILSCRCSICLFLFFFFLHGLSVNSLLNERSDICDTKTSRLNPCSSVTQEQNWTCELKYSRVIEIMPNAVATTRVIYWLLNLNATARNISCRKQTTFQSRSFSKLLRNGCHFLLALRTNFTLLISANKFVYFTANAFYQRWSWQ